MDNLEIVLLDARQTVMQSIVADGVTFALLLLCIWASQGSKWWTFFTALMFLAYLGGKCAEGLDKRRHKFKNLDALAEWVKAERDNARVNASREAASR